MVRYKWFIYFIGILAQKKKQSQSSACMLSERKTILRFCLTKCGMHSGHLSQYFAEPIFAAITAIHITG